MDRTCQPLTHRNIMTYEREIAARLFFFFIIIRPGFTIIPHWIFFFFSTVCHLSLSKDCLLWGTTSWSYCCFLGDFFNVSEGHLIKLNFSFTFLNFIFFYFWRTTPTYRQTLMHFIFSSSFCTVMVVITHAYRPCTAFSSNILLHQRTMLSWEQECHLDYFKL